MTSLLNDIIRYTDEDGIQPNEDIHRVRYGRVPSSGASSLEATGNPCYWDLTDAPSNRHGQLLTPFPALHSLRSVEKWGDWGFRERIWAGLKIPSL